ncbi:N-acetylmuramoyl-L-alanine amidase [Flavobacterium sp.]|uniref:N-acetylmuramoyl-L-alanine amidase family protein n=1 Tax=Flavobacterium sp. TaxID=239 RepID=UPI002B4AEBA0|nr:N-acetylmuramoyl-L-alanine amidase [Flavobacterium sp.]HLF53448.1 N-acetylmuramoyl-L-alanine amidase [Flavobacterium sp.]
MKNTTKLFLALTALISFAFVKPKFIEPKQINVVIDASHGGYDSGAKVGGFTEKQIVEQITHKIYALNKNKNVVIHLTRSSDTFVSLVERTNTINALKPDLVLSLHVNSNSNKNKSGMEMYVANENKSSEMSLAFAGKLYDKFINNNLKVNEIKNAKFYILKKSEVPAVLVELGYLSNESDSKYLTDEKEQNRLAETIIDFISELK